LLTLDHEKVRLLPLVCSALLEGLDSVGGLGGASSREKLRTGDDQFVRGVWSALSALTLQ
jgi:hypothetical protein